MKKFIAILLAIALIVPMVLVPSFADQAMMSLQLPLAIQ